MKKVTYAKKGKIIQYHKGGIISELKLGVPVKGYGRWIYCKYCYKNVQPYYLEEELDIVVKSVKQVIIGCPICTSGLKIG